MEVDPRLKNTIGSWVWRMNNLYYVVDDDGKKVKFRMRPEQESLFDGMHDKNIILKARQFGITTFFVIFYLDRILFCPNINCVLISHGKDPSKELFQKVIYAYENLPRTLKNLRPDVTRNNQKLVIQHGPGDLSSFSVAVSARSGTVNYLHISEFGKICALYPAKAEEIISGSLNAGLSMKCLTIESTGEGKSGSFYDMCVGAMDLRGQHLPNLNRLQYKFWFFPWYNQHLCTEPCPGDYEFSDFWDDYFGRIEGETGDLLSRDRRYWYVNKELEQKDKMKQEYPSTEEEAFQANLDGAWYKRPFAILDKKMRITKVDHDPRRRVCTAWDKGVRDHTAIWFYQLPLSPNGDIDIINYYENSGEVLDFYAAILDKYKEKYKYDYGVYWGPHDIKRTVWASGKTDWEVAQDKFGITFQIAPNLSIVQGIDRAREVLLRCRFDREKTSIGVDHLRNYTKKSDKEGGFIDVPVHNIHSHCADGFRVLSLSDLTREEINIGGNVLSDCYN